MVLDGACKVSRSSDPLLCMVRDHEKTGIRAFLFKAATRAADELGLVFDTERGDPNSVTELEPVQQKAYVKAAKTELLLRLHKDKPMHAASHQRTKLLQSVTLDEHLTLDNCHYELYAAVFHCGSSVDSGHYYTLARDKTDWFKFNDAYVSKATPENLSCLKPPETPYILFYCREDLSDLEILPTTVLSRRLQILLSKDNSESE